MLLSAGIIMVRKEEAEWKYLLLRAYRNWDFPKGIVESGETPMETAIREMKEETGISEHNFRWGEVYQETLPYNRGTKVARYYIAATSESEVRFSINPEIGKPEHHEYRWVSYDESIKLSPERLVPIIKWAQDVIKQNDS
ncbi:MAG: NUDIX domain-containing protein [Desulfobacterales bacterium]|nr:MAG: NUDIX domain-containing protein [Desulfobacterales bacterium]